MTQDELYHNAIDEAIIQFKKSWPWFRDICKENGMREISKIPPEPFLAAILAFNRFVGEHNASIAQTVEQLPCKEKVAGATPVAGSKSLLETIPKEQLSRLSDQEADEVLNEFIVNKFRSLDLLQSKVQNARHFCIYLMSIINNSSAEDLVMEPVRDFMINSESLEDAMTSINNLTLNSLDEE